MEKKLLDSFSLKTTALNQSYVCITVQVHENLWD